MSFQVPCMCPQLKDLSRLTNTLRKQKLLTRDFLKLLWKNQSYADLSKDGCFVLEEYLNKWTTITGWISTQVTDPGILIIEIDNTLTTTQAFREKMNLTAKDAVLLVSEGSLNSSELEAKCAKCQPK